MPILKRAESALGTLTTADIAIVKAMKKPPQGVRLILESVCVLKVGNLSFDFDTVPGKCIGSFTFISTTEGKIKTASGST